MCRALRGTRRGIEEGKIILVVSITQVTGIDVSFHMGYGMNILQMSEN